MNTLKSLQFWLLLTIATYLSLTPAPPQAMQSISDKLLHTLGYLGLFLSGALADLQPRKSFMLLFGYSCLIEVLQHFIPNRGFSLEDILANAVGLSTGVVLLYAVRQFRQRP